MSVAGATTIDRIYDLLSIDPKDYFKLAEQLNNTLDINNMLDFILCLVCNGHLSNPNVMLSDANWRARRLMVKIITKTPVIPTSLIVTGVTMLAKRDYIGSGGFGRVYKGELGGTTVALKVLYKANNTVAFCREALMWGSLKHKFVLPFSGIYELEGGTAPEIFLVSPYMKNGTLAQWRKTANPLIAEIAERIMEVAQGIEYIHSEGVIHGDLRGDNVLLDANLHVQIADFGLTRLSEATTTRSGALHLNFAAPELFDSGEDDDDVAVRTQKSDVYAFGCLYYEIHYDIMPFAGKTDMQILKLISQGMRPPRCDEPPLSDYAWELIQCCWAQDASERPGMRNATEWMIAILIRSSTDSPPTSPPYRWPASQIPNVDHMTLCPTSPPLPLVTSCRPSPTWLEDLSAYTPTESLLDRLQSFKQPDQSDELSTNRYYNVPDQPTLRAPKQPQLQRRPRNADENYISTDVERRSRKENENYIKRPENAYILFRRQCCEDRQQEDTTDSPVQKQRQADLSKTISQQWKSLSPEERQYWEHLAKEKQKEHEEKYPNYVYRPQRYNPKPRKTVKSRRHK